MFGTRKAGEIIDVLANATGWTLKRLLKTSLRRHDRMARDRGRNTHAQRLHSQRTQWLVLTSDISGGVL